jgi:protein SCO1/2
MFLRNLLLIGTIATAPASPLADIGPAPSVSLTDSEGRPFDLARCQGKVVLVSFVFTTCNGTCPLTSATMARCRDALKTEGLWGTQVEFVSITLDPKHDTPEALKLYADIYRADPASWHFLTGPPETVKRVIADWGMWAKRTPAGVLDHPSRIFLVDPRGRQREIYSLEFLSPEAVTADVRGLLDEAKAR